MNCIVSMAMQLDQALLQKKKKMILDLPFKKNKIES